MRARVAIGSVRPLPARQRCVDLLRDTGGEAEGREAILAGNERARPSTDGAHEPFQLGAQRLLLLDGHVEGSDLRSALRALSEAIAVDLLLLGVDGDVRIAREDPKLPDAVVRNAAGS